MKYSPSDAWELLKEAKKIHGAKGKKVRAFNPSKDDKEAIMKSALGPSGNMRAPVLEIRKGLFVIGFNEELYAELFM